MSEQKSCPIVNAHCPFDYALFGGAVCVLGVFDGVHLGHRYLISRAIEKARETNKRCVIITFSVDPEEIFDGAGLMKLQTNDERFKTLATLGANSVAVLPFDKDFASMSPLQFLAKIFRKFPPSYIYVGKNFRFGKNAEGDVGLLKDWASKNGVEVCALDLLQAAGENVSSTRIRKLIKNNDEARALELLGKNRVNLNGF